MELFLCAVFGFLCGAGIVSAFSLFLAAPTVPKWQHDILKSEWDADIRELLPYRSECLKLRENEKTHTAELLGSLQANEQIQRKLEASEKRYQSLVDRASELESVISSIHKSSACAVSAPLPPAFETAPYSDTDIDTLDSDSDIDEYLDDDDDEWDDDDDFDDDYGDDEEDDY